MKVVLFAAFLAMMVSNILGLLCHGCEQIVSGKNYICDPNIRSLHYNCKPDEPEPDTKFCYTKFVDKSTPESRRCAPQWKFEGFVLQNGCKEVRSIYDKVTTMYCFCNSDMCNNHTQYV